ncbi:ornithine carbamoyltransferase [Pullulanibacillus pueri]|uniref:Ornithine carbamoyltransferase n=1 Tax=Pullulanibacillus pueri TaxID=1437324 RepID=A0A8J3EMR5_9BACL|nr:ornithine carbamoyltransferase [Pullulanibacillus pueri]MBM7683227.1 ornithine carbamoyltransferase [Pullulanibacillus pueri]GGH85516.1 ornithine carbamoyltransferase [Pullulanibacillus pueri]
MMKTDIIAPYPLSVKAKHFLKLSDYQPNEILYLLDSALEMKSLQKKGIPHPYLSGKVLGMIFEKSSTRTRVSFTVGMKQLGGDAIFLSSNDIQLGRGETVEDTAKVLSRYVDGLMIRTFAHETIECFAENANVPVINGLTDLHHPTQVMADLLTIYEHKGKLQGLKMCYIGDGNNNMCHSLLEGAVAVGMDIVVASPEAYAPNDHIFQEVKAKAQVTQSDVSFTTSAEEAVTDADIIVTDVWTSMGQEAEKEERLKIFAPYQVNTALCSHAKEDYLFLHCLPAHRGEEVTTEIIDGPHSVVFDEAENRLHAQKAILKALV